MYSFVHQNPELKSGLMYQIDGVASLKNLSLHDVEVRGRMTLYTEVPSGTMARLKLKYIS